MKILIIGGSRFVGPLLIERLLKKGHELTLFNRGNVQSKYDPKIKFIKGDRNMDFAKINGIFDVVIDMCAYNGVQTKQAIEQLNFDFFINFGTIASYKKTDDFPLKESDSIGIWPLWGDYNIGKVEGEEVLKNSSIKYASIRPTFILGANNYMDRESFIYSHLRKNQPLILPGDGNAKLQFVFADEVAEAISILAENKIQGEFNCSGDDVTTPLNLVNEMAKISNTKPIIKFNPKTDGENWNDVEFPFPNEPVLIKNDKIKNLGVKFTPLKQGLKRDYENYYKEITK